MIFLFDKEKHPEMEYNYIIKQLIVDEEKSI
jgi:hypothetical protein